MGRGTLEEVWNGSRDTRGDPGRVKGPKRRLRIGRWTLAEVRNWSRSLGEVRDGSGDSRGSPGRIEEPLERSGTGHGTLGEFRDG